MICLAKLYILLFQCSIRHFTWRPTYIVFLAAT